MSTLGTMPNALGLYPGAEGRVCNRVVIWPPLYTCKLNLPVPGKVHWGRVGLEAGDSPIAGWQWMNAVRSGHMGREEELCDVLTTGIIQEGRWIHPSNENRQKPVLEGSTLWWVSDLSRGESVWTVITESWIPDSFHIPCGWDREVDRQILEQTLKPWQSEEKPFRIVFR